MIKEKLLSVFATCMALSVVSLVYAQETPLYDYVKPNDEAPCIEALVVVRHAEDNDPKSSEKHELTTGGKAHAQAYKELVGLLTRMLGICPVYYFVSSDRGSENPYMTVKPSADYYGISIIIKWSQTLRIQIPIPVNLRLINLTSILIGVIQIFY